ncbi:hypothetical protein WS89_04005 [Burkholderia sp. MSMB1072]|uniref:hypothetical protein n=1 Tax=Burkholderia sp. MSMB1072 TaxID=1637871 RepID=UPI0007542873|nr:hypothetical protein [Burkholderia sp. MSMB1072]KVH64455.1 hypothetical protein WS89_04005 [Burkholderia sp. MSMB1072]
MDNSTYRNRVLETESKPGALNFGPATLLVALNMAVAATMVLDQVKRAIYYGKEMDPNKALDSLGVMQSAGESLKFTIGTGRYRDPMDVHFFMDKLPKEVVQQINPQNVDMRLLHAALGGFTESGEFIEALLPTLLGKPVDRVNVAEELGDANWYGEIALDALGLTREEVNAANIKKLQDKKAGRYKAGTFLSDDAVNRDTGAERAVLEEAVA